VNFKQIEITNDHKNYSTLNGASQAKPNRLLNDGQIKKPGKLFSIDPTTVRSLVLLKCMVNEFFTRLPE